MPVPDPCQPCPVCGEKLIRVKLFAREWWECPNSVLEFFNGMCREGEEKFYDGPTHKAKVQPSENTG